MEKFTASFDSLQKYQCPDWFRDAKFGIWSHWGPQSVPMYGDGYAKFMYTQGTDQYRYHCRKYGHPSEFGYKDLVKLWKAERFDPEHLMGLYKKAGARYFVSQAVHYENFFNYPTKLNRFNSVNMGPQKDICGLWKAAADKAGLPFGMSEHMSRSFNTIASLNKSCDDYGPYKGIPYDTNNPDFYDFYFDTTHETLGKGAKHHTENVEFRKYWQELFKELVDFYEPDLIYSDSPLPFGEMNSPLDDESYRTGLESLAYFYNKSLDKHGYNRAVYNQKDIREEIASVGVFDMERNQLPGINKHPWQTDTCIGGWFYDVRKPYKKPGHIIEMLVDIVAKNGNLLLNIIQRPDGTVDEETMFILEELAAWFELCGEGIYDTRPWINAAEGAVEAHVGHGYGDFVEEETRWTSSDFRFTCKGDTVFAFIMGVPEDRVSVLKSFNGGERVVKTRLLGFGEIPFSQKFGIVTVELPRNLPAKYANCLAVELN